jgi:RNA polymerase sigma-70 factor, ECF subfamily
MALSSENVEQPRGRAGAAMGASGADAEQFQALRPLLFSIAYRMLGSATEAEDVIQDAYLRYATARPAEVRSLKDYLSTIVTRLCMDRLKSARMTREQYIGPWLPEPIVTGGPGADPLGAAERHETITLAFLVLLEALSPQERAVFLLREVFEYGYDEIAAMLELSEANCRQLFHRARQHISDQRPRFVPSKEEQQRFMARFMAAIQQGDVAALASMLAHDVVSRADGGGKASAPKKVVEGALPVARLLIGLSNKSLSTIPDLRMTLEDVNGTLSLLVWSGQTLDSVMTWTIVDGLITTIETVRNPDKLVYIQQQLARRSL